jgi:predicted phage tail component-like protein
VLSLPTRLDDKYFSDFGPIKEVVGHSNPATPEFTQKTVSIPGRPGVWDFGHEIGTRSFEIPLKYLVNDKYERQRILNDLVAFLFDEYGKPKTRKLYFDYEPDKYYNVKLATQIDPERLLFTNSFSLQFKADNPYKNFMLPSDEIVWGADIPFMSDILLDTGGSIGTITSSRTISILNQGNIAKPLSITIQGSGTNVRFIKGNKSFSLGTFSNKTIVIDGDAYSVYVNGVETFSALTGDFLTLNTGVNNIRISGTGLNFNLTESLIYQYY